MMVGVGGGGGGYETPGEGHLQALQYNRLEVEDFGVEVNGAKGA